MREGIKHETCVRTFNAEKRGARVNLKASDGTHPKIVFSPPPPKRQKPPRNSTIQSSNFPTRNSDQNPRKRWTKTTRCSPSQSVVWGAPKRAQAKNSTTRQSIFRLGVDRVGRGPKRAPPHADRPGVQWKHGRNFGGRFSRSLDPRLFRLRRWLRLSRWRGRSSAGGRWYRGRRGSGPGPVNFHHPPAGIAASLWLVIPAGFAARRRGVSLRSFFLHGEGGGKWCRIRELAVEKGGRIAPAGRFRRDIFPAGIFFRARWNGTALPLRRARDGGWRPRRWDPRPTGCCSRDRRAVPLWPWDWDSPVHPTGHRRRWRFPFSTGCWWFVVSVWTLNRGILVRQFLCIGSFRFWTVRPCHRE